LPRKYSIIIVTWNALEHLKTFLPSVSATEYPDYEIIIANNASTDGTAGWIHEQYPEFKIVTFSKNHGYCGGNNRASDYATGDIIVFLNNDVMVEPDWLKHLDTIFEQKQIVAAQPKIRSYYKTDYFEHAGAAGGYLDRYGYPFCRGRIFESIEMDSGQYDAPEKILWASGAALAIRKDIFFKMEKFDEDFEFHMEEIDLCWRLWNRGFLVVCQPQSVVYHLGGGSMPTGSTRKFYYNYRNNLIMMVKNLSSQRFIPRMLTRMLMDGIAGLRSFIKLKPQETWAIIRAHFAFYRRIFSTLEKRKKLQEIRVDPSDPVVLVNKNIVKEYFLFGNKTFSELMADKRKER